MEGLLELPWVTVNLDFLRAVRFPRPGFSNLWGVPLPIGYGLSLQEHEHEYSRVVR